MLAPDLLIETVSLCPSQVIEHKGAAAAEAATAKEELEATLGMQLAHPNIVRTLKFATRQRGQVGQSILFPTPNRL